MYILFGFVAPRQGEYPGLRLIDQTEGLKQLQIMKKKIAFKPH